MRIFMLIIFLLVVVVYSVCFAADYEITNVVEVGPAIWAPFLGPLRWSPDGTRLAFFEGEGLNLSDTLGNVRLVKSIDMHPRRFEWIDDNTIAVMFRRRFDSDSTVNRMVLIEVSSGEETLIDRYVETRKALSTPGYQEFEGPLRTIEGNVYYNLTTYASRSSATVERHWLIADKSAPPENNHILKWTEQGLYSVNFDGNDSTLIIEEPTDLHVPKRITISANGIYEFRNGNISSLDGLESINIKPFFEPIPPEATGCGFVFISFHPSRSEILFQLTCDKGERVLLDRVCTFDWINHYPVILDTALGLTNCTTPVYSPDGDKIALLSEKKAYIIYRRYK